MPDFRGRQTYTEERLYSYLQQFERDFALSTRCIVDATEGGVAKAGAVHMPLAEALETYCREPITKVLPPHAGMDWSRLDEAEACLQRRLEDAREIERISHETLPLLTRMISSIDDPARLQQLLTSADALRTEINDYAVTYDLITQLSQRSELDRFAADRRITAAGINGVEKQKRQLSRDVDNVTHVADAAGIFQTLMGECIDTIHDTRARRGKAA